MSTIRSVLVLELSVDRLSDGRVRRWSSLAEYRCIDRDGVREDSAHTASYGHICAGCGAVTGVRGRGSGFGICRGSGRGRCSAVVGGNGFVHRVVNERIV